MSEENQSGIDRSRCRPGIITGPGADTNREAVYDDEAIKRDRDEFNRFRALLPFSFDPILYLPIDEEELQSAADAVLDEQLKLIETLESRTPEEENADEMRDV
jgi:hypothetical protein